MAALLAIFLQAFVVQTHIHGPAPFTAVIEQSTDAASAQHVSATDEHQVACALCQMLATASSATVPDSTSVLAADRVTDAAFVALSAAPRPHTHSWRSRAPPKFL